jgi:site-specific recombinase XerD
MTGVNRTTTCVDGESRKVEAFLWGHPGGFMALPIASGPLRGSNPVINARSDGEAVAMWIAEKGRGSKNTAESYRREAERFLLWASEILNKSLSEVMRDEFLIYERFMAEVPGEWICSRGIKRRSHAWRPFSSQPSSKSISHSMRILYGMMQYLVKVGWLETNPMPQPKCIAGEKWRPTRKALSDSDINCILESIQHASCVATAREKAFLARDRWIVMFLSIMAARASETITSMGSITQEMVGSSSMWVWEVTGKGNITDTLPITDEILTELKLFRVKLGMSPTPLVNDKMALVPVVSGVDSDGYLVDLTRSMGRNSLYKRIKEVIIPRAIEYAIENSKDVDCERLAKASTHWFRHTALTGVAVRTGDMRMVQALGRHQDINTSAGYVKTDLLELKEAMSRGSE